MDTTIFLTITSTSTQQRLVPQATSVYPVNTLNNIEIVTTLITSVIPKTPAVVKTEITQVISEDSPLLSSLMRSSSNTTKSASSASIVSSDTLNQLPAGSSSSSLKSGLAIGLPVAIVLIFIIAIVASFLIKGKKFKHLIDGGTNFINVSKENHNNKNVNADVESVYGEIPPHEPHLGLQSGKDQNKDKRQSVLYYVRDRLSKVGTSKPTSQQAEVDTSSRPISQLLSPIFLKKFNLNKPKSKLPYHYETSSRENVSSRDSRNKLNLRLPVSTNVEPQVNVSAKLDPRNQEIYITIQSYTRRLKDELTLKIGDKVVIQQDYLDGWCLVRLLSNETSVDFATGMVPKICLRQIK